MTAQLCTDTGNAGCGINRHGAGRVCATACEWNVRGPGKSPAARLRCYIAGPMRGLPLWGFPAFDAAAKMLTSLGYAPVSPAAMDRAEGVDESEAPADGSFAESDYHAAMRRDISALLTVDGLVLLKGWEQSQGANVEFTVAKAMGLPVYRAVYAAGAPIGIEVYA